MRGGAHTRTGEIKSDQGIEAYIPPLQRTRWTTPQTT
jgi:hypothetical protein